MSRLAVRCNDNSKKSGQGQASKVVDKVRERDSDPQMTRGDGTFAGSAASKG